MAERIEFVGNPLPVGLPGFGGGTVSVLVLPGFNTVVAVQQFGPVVDAPTVRPPDPEPPEGSNPENPTTNPVNPGPAPSLPGTSNNFCERCVPPNDEDLGNPLYYAALLQSGCEDCDGFTPGQVIGPAVASSNDGQDGIRFTSPSTLRGSGNGYAWRIDAGTIYMASDDSAEEALIVPGLITLTDDGGNDTKFGVGPEIVVYDGKKYKPEDLEVCEGGETKTWKVLAYKPD